MARGRGRPSTKRRPATRSTGALASAGGADAPVDANAWMLDVDTTVPITQETLRRVYRLDRRCVATVGSHKGKLCADSPDCLVGFYNKPRRHDVVTQSIGRSAPQAVATRDVATEGAGMRNCGNTCYLNAVTQMLARCPRLLRSLLGSKEAAADEEGVANADKFHIPAVFANLLRSQRASVDPLPMIEALKLDVSVQQDAQEYLSLFLSLLSDGSRPMNDAIVRDFNGNLLYSRKCGECGAVTKKTDRFLFMTVPTTPNADVADCIRDSLKPEETTGASCETCEKTDVTISTTVAIKSVPPYLVVHLMRFQYDVARGQRKKVADPIKIGRTFPVSAISGDESDKRWYRIRAVVDHLGHTPTNGHYVASCVPLTGERADDANGVGPDDWHRHDDATTKVVKPFSEKDPMSFTSKDAYMVLYELVQEPTGAVGGPPMAPEEHRTALVAAVSEADESTAAAAKAYNDLKAIREKEVDAWFELCDEVFAGSLANTNRGKAASATLTDVAALDDYASEQRYFVSENWLKAFAKGAFMGEDADAARRIANTDLVCSHGAYVDPARPFRTLTKPLWDRLRAAQGVDRTLPTATAMCDRCSMRLIEEKKSGDAALDAWRQLQAKIRAGVTPQRVVVAVDDSDDEKEAAADDSEDEERVPDQFIAATVHDSILDQDRPPPPEEAVLIDLTAPLVCPHQGILPDVTRKPISAEAFDGLLAHGYTCATHFPTPAEEKDYGSAVCHTCLSERQSAIQQVNTVKALKFAVLRDLKDRLVHHDNNRAIFNRNLANYTTQHRKKWNEQREKAKAEAAAAKEAEEKAAAEKAKAEAAAQANQMRINIRTKGSSQSPPPKSPTDAKHVDPNREDTVQDAPEDAEPQCPDRRVEHFIVPLSWVEKLNEWLDDQTHSEVAPPPHDIPLDAFKCEHGFSAIGVNDIHPSRRREGPIAIVLKEAEFELLGKHFNADRAAAFRLVELNDVRLIDPRECPDCIEKRRESEEAAAKFFTNGTIKVVGRFKKNKKHRLNVDMEVPEVAHDTTFSAFAATVAQHIHNSYEVFVPPEHIGFVVNKAPVEDPSKQCFSDCGVLDGDTVTIEVGDDVVANAKQANTAASETWQEIPPELLEQPSKGKGKSRGEVAFGGSAFAGAGAGTSGPAAGVVSCPLCTFDNPPGSKVCEMCESLL